MTVKPLDVLINDINTANIAQLRVLNVSTLPVRYTDKFYKDLLINGFAEYLKFASWNGFAVAAVCARIEPHDTVKDSFKLYIMTINVLAAYRRRGIGAKLLEYVLETARNDTSIIEVYLHVQVILHFNSYVRSNLIYYFLSFLDYWDHQLIHPHSIFQKNVDIFQTSNLEAKEFYVANGFIETEVIKDYYKRIDPPGDCISI
jgi:ribosomal protein S18 acetylase RimI-like enzyme